MEIEVVGGIIILWLVIGALTGVCVAAFNDDLTFPEVLVMGIVWPITMVGAVVVGAIRLVRRFDLL